jgi:hypothetical protein
VTGESKGKRAAFTVLTILFAVASFGGLLGIAIIIGWFDGEEGGIHRVHQLGYGIAYGVVVTTAFAVLARRPETKPSALLQVLVAAVAAAIAAVLSSESDYLVIAGAIAVPWGVLVALYPDQSSVFRPKANPSTPMALFAVAGSVPLVWFGLTSARLQRTGSTFDPHVAAGHWTTMAAMAFTLALVGLLASARIRGWRITAWCAGLGVAVYGVASIVFHRLPGTDLPYAGSEGTAWGLVALIGGLAFVGLAEWEARRPGAART